MSRGDQRCVYSLVGGGGPGQGCQPSCPMSPRSPRRVQVSQEKHARTQVSQEHLGGSRSHRRNVGGSASRPFSPPWGCSSSVVPRGLILCPATPLGGRHEARGGKKIYNKSVTTFREQVNKPLVTVTTRGEMSVTDDPSVFLRTKGPDIERADILCEDHVDLEGFVRRLPTDRLQ